MGGSALDSVTGLLPCFFPVLFFAFFILIWVIANGFEKKKLERFMKFAMANGLSFLPGLSGGGGGNWFEQMFAGVQGTQSFLMGYQGFRPISHMNATVKYIFEGRSDDIYFRAFQYQYTTGSGKNRQTHYYTVASCELPGWMPDLSVSPEGFFDMVGKFFGGQDIQFESHEFNEKFRIMSSNVKFAHDVLHPQMMEWFLHVVPPGFQLHGRTVVLWRNGTLEENFVLDSRAMMRQFWVLVPDYVKEDVRH